MRLLLRLQRVTPSRYNLTDSDRAWLERELLRCMLASPPFLPPTVGGEYCVASVFYRQRDADATLCVAWTFLSKRISSAGATTLRLAWLGHSCPSKACRRGQRHYDGRRPERRRTCVVRRRGRRCDAQKGVAPVLVVSETLTLRDVAWTFLSKRMRRRGRRRYAWRGLDIPVQAQHDAKKGVAPVLFVGGTPMLRLCVVGGDDNTMPRKASHLCCSAAGTPTLRSTAYHTCTTPRKASHLCCSAAGTTMRRQERRRTCVVRRRGRRRYAGLLAGGTMTVRRHEWRRTVGA